MNAAFPARPAKVMPLGERLGQKASAPGARPLFEALRSASPADREEIERLAAEARARGEAEGMRAAEAKQRALLDRYAAAIQALAEATRRARPMAAEVVNLALVVAREIIGRDVVRDGDRWMAALDEALSSVDTDGAAVVRLSPHDAAELRRRHPDVAALVHEDPRLAPGGYVLETPHRVIDASIEARLEAVRGALCALLEEEATERPGGGEAGR
jgi:flagellar assembly protein FliH